MTRQQTAMSGEGAGVVVLKKLSDALADGDNIIAVIRGTAVNQDGRSSSLTVPNGPSQQAVIRRALEDGDIEPGQISYVEGHGTGTALSDPIEIGALNAVFGRGRPADNPLFIGSVKTNFGHLEAAAGIAGLIKTALSLQNNEIPPHLHFDCPNPEMPWDRMPLQVPTKHTPWIPGETPRIAGVSSFAFSGTNAHVVISDFDRPTDRPTGFPKPRRSADEPSILTLSARTEESLKSLAGRYENYLSSNPDSDLEDICFTANACRSHFTHRLSITAESRQQALEKISGFAGGEILPGVLTGRASEQPKTAFLLTGQGTQYIGMGRELYETQPVFRQTLDQCNEILRPYLEKTLLEVLYPGRGASGLHSHAERGNEVEEAASVLGLDLSSLPDPKQGFFDMGMDSLMAVELKNRLEAGVKISLPATLLFGSSTSNGLADYLIREVPDLKTENKTDNQVSSFNRHCRHRHGLSFSRR